jgi:predicted  nucleic acid-binding Zn-ribbon protein
MTLLRSDRQATLAELHARGAELLLRYEAAAELEALPSALRATLERLAAERRPLVEALADLERAHEDLPKAGNEERAWVQALTDRFWRALLGDTHDLIERLRISDREWLERVEQARELDWLDEEAAIIDRLAGHLRKTLQTLAPEAS